MDRKHCADARAANGLLGSFLASGMQTGTMSVAAGSVIVNGIGGSLAGVAPGLGGVTQATEPASSAGGQGSILGAVGGTLAAPFAQAKKLVTTSSGQVLSYGTGAGDQGALPIDVQPIGSRTSLSLTELPSVQVYPVPRVQSLGAPTGAWGPDRMPVDYYRSQWSFSDMIPGAANKPWLTGDKVGGRLSDEYSQTAQTTQSLAQLRTGMDDLTQTTSGASNAVGDFTGSLTSALGSVTKGGFNLGGIFGPNSAQAAETTSGYADGGYTGSGGRFEPAGYVHKGEFVFDQSSVGRIGLDTLEAMHRGFPGYDIGGPVQPVGLPPLLLTPPSAAAGASFTVNQAPMTVNAAHGYTPEQIRAVMVEEREETMRQVRRNVVSMHADASRRWA